MDSISKPVFVVGCFLLCLFVCLPMALNLWSVAERSNLWMTHKIFSPLSLSPFSVSFCLFVFLCLFLFISLSLSLSPSLFFLFFPCLSLFIFLSLPLSHVFLFLPVFLPLLSAFTISCFFCLSLSHFLSLLYFLPLPCVFLLYYCTW